MGLTEDEVEMFRRLVHYGTVNVRDPRWTDAEIKEYKSYKEFFKYSKSLFNASVELVVDGKIVIIN